MTPMGYMLGNGAGEPILWAFVLAAILVAMLVAFVVWARVIKKRLGAPPPDRAGHETERFRFKYGADPPGWD